MALKQVQAVAAIEAVAGNIIKASLCEVPGGWLALTEAEGVKRLAYAVRGEAPLAQLFKAVKEEEVEGLKVMVMELNANNAAVVRRYVKWSAPSACGVKGTSLGFSDWLGAADAVVTDLFIKKQIKPVLVEYTPEDSVAVKRNFLEAVDTATWGVLEKGYKEGYGANAAGLKSEEDIVKALLYGYSMIGFDCTDKIDLEIEKLSDAEVERRFEQFNEVFRAAVNASYLNAEFKVGNSKISFTENQLHRIVLEYGEAIMHIQFIYNSYLKSTPWDIDFELDLSKPGKVLTPAEHYLIANELQRNGIKMTALCLDAENEAEALAENMAVHADIADTYGYRLSIKNADKALEDVAGAVKLTKGKVHFKLNNVLWMSLVKFIAQKDAALYEKLAAACGVEAVAVEEICSSGACAKLGQAYKEVLKPENELAAELKAFALANKAEYQEYLKAGLAENFLKKM